jgi:hypothetical protein
VILIDTTVWIDYLRGITTSQVEWLEGALERQRLGLVDLILCEVLQGVCDHQQLEEVSRDWQTRSGMRGGLSDLLPWPRMSSGDLALRCGRVLPGQAQEGPVARHGR